MAAEYVPIDITNAPELAQVAEAVRQSGKPHALKRGAEIVAVVRPAPKPERRASSSGRSRRRDRVFTLDDSLWEIVGIARGAGPENVSGNVDHYLAEAYRDEHL